MRAVVVEDEILIREGLCKLLHKMFPDILIEGVAGNGQEGLQYIEEYQPDLVITDIKMPLMDGLKMLQKVQEAGLFPKVIVLTAYSEFEYAKQAVKLGVCDYIIKPVVVQEFVQTIRKVQNLYEQEQKRTPETMGSLEHIVSGLLYGVSAMDDKMQDFLFKKYAIAEQTPLMELLIYMGDSFEAGREKKRQEMCRILEQERRPILPGGNGVRQGDSGAHLRVFFPTGDRALVSESDSVSETGRAGAAYQLWNDGSCRSQRH